MPEILPDHVPSPRTPLGWDGTRYQAFRIHTDGTLQVRGEDQLFSYLSSLHARAIGAISAANGYKDSATPGAGEVWVVKNVVATDATTATTRHTLILYHAPTNYHFGAVVAAFAVDENSYWSGEVILEPGDVVRVYFVGGLVADACSVILTGYRMTLET